MDIQLDTEIAVMAQAGRARLSDPQWRRHFQPIPLQFDDTQRRDAVQDRNGEDHGSYAIIGQSPPHQHDPHSLASGTSRNTHGGFGTSPIPWHGRRPKRIAQ